MQGKAAQLSTLKQALMVGGGKRFAERGEELLSAIAEFLITDAIRSWLFRVNAAGRSLVYLVARLDFTPLSDEEAGTDFSGIKSQKIRKLLGNMQGLRTKFFRQKLENGAMLYVLK